MARDGRGAQLLTLDDEPRVIALLTTAYEQPIEPDVLTKLLRACELWNADEKVRESDELPDTSKNESARCLPRMASDTL
ncbi:MAG: hypothetical protein USCAAHI_00845 [Beijerinckiaceae bacterium]|nr:MAG: hypothetical protein USCAAHI_00845 [Beijerinckiaceae bacterium]